MTGFLFELSLLKRLFFSQKKVFGFHSNILDIERSFRVKRMVEKSLPGFVYRENLCLTDLSLPSGKRLVLHEHLEMHHTVRQMNVKNRFLRYMPWKE